jgi:bla regulator protein BlaR1
MIPAHWTTALANHLWQSTLLATAAALLARALQKNHARTRYWLWLTASIKFLVPFSWLVAIGGRLAWPAAAAIARPRVPAVMNTIAQPFLPVRTGAAVAAAVPGQHGSILPVVLAAIWICGFIAVVFSWWRRWRRIRAAALAATPLAVEAGVPVLSSQALVEPGIFGIFHPVLLLPEGITTHLAPAHLQAIIAHELCHVRRRDNLAAAIHMAVEAVFWFHPLVWWIGSRMMEERERACDEEVLRRGSKPEIYAESILKTCQFYLESPLACMSGITGADLKRRIVRIMTPLAARELSFARKALLAVAGAVAVAGPVVFGLANAPESRAQSQADSGAPLPSFEVASIKPDRSGTGKAGIQVTPGRFNATNITPKLLIDFASDIKDPQLSGAPGWISTERYDVEAKEEDSADLARRTPEQREKQLRLMMRSLLADRFKLKLVHQTKELPVYALVVAKGGPKIKESAGTPDDAGPNPPGPPVQLGPKGKDQPYAIQKDPWIPGGPKRMAMMRPGQLTMSDVPVSLLADSLSRMVGRNVIDKTGLKGNYDATLQWTPDPGQGQMFGGPPGGPDGKPLPEPPPDASGPDIFTAVQEQLGLKLESEKGPVDTYAIESIEKPSEN